MTHKNRTYHERNVELITYALKKDEEVDAIIDAVIEWEGTVLFYEPSYGGDAPVYDLRDHTINSNGFSTVVQDKHLRQEMICAVIRIMKGGSNA